MYDLTLPEQDSASLSKDDEVTLHPLQAKNEAQQRLAVAEQQAAEARQEAVEARQQAAEAREMTVIAQEQAAVALRHADALQAAAMEAKLIRQPRFDDGAQSTAPTKETTVACIKHRRGVAVECCCGWKPHC